MPDPENDAPDVLPETATRLLAVGWILLFGGRWIGVTLLLAAGLLSADQAADLDRGLLLWCYLVLLVITLIVVILRALRGARPAVSSGPSVATKETSVRSSSPSSRTSATRGRTRD
jgi:hypothetical protein